MSEKIRFLEDILQESGGFGCGHVNEAYVEEEFQESEYNEEESGGDEVESNGGMKKILMLIKLVMWR